MLYVRNSTHLYQLKFNDSNSNFCDCYYYFYALNCLRHCQAIADPFPVPKIFEVIYVEVQFYRWFKFSFLLFQASLSYITTPRNKRKEIQTNRKIEPQHIRLHSNNKMEKIRLICILTRSGFTIYHMPHFLFLQWGFAQSSFSSR